MTDDHQNTSVLIIGGSAGSLTVILEIVKYLAKGTLAVVIVTHRKSSDDGTLLEILRTRTTMDVKEAEEKEVILPGVIYVAPADYHLLIEKNFTFTLDDSEKIHYSRPSIDVTFETAAQAFREKAVCILLSGANADGVDGLKTAKQFGTRIVVHDPSTAEVPFMPQRALDVLIPDHILNPQSLHSFLNDL